MLHRKINILSQEHWQWKVGSFAIWLSWMELLLLIQKLPKGIDKLLLAGWSAIN